MWRILFAIGLLSAAPAAAAIVYDPPLASESFVQPGENGSLARIITCRRYPHFVVKTVQWDTPFANVFVEAYQDKPAPCRPSPKEMSTRIFGDFAGVKGRFIVLDNNEAGNDWFQVFDAVTGKRLVQEPAAASPESMILTADGFVLRLNRRYQAECSLFYGPATACWTAVKAATGLGDAAFPDCAPAYDAEYRKWHDPLEKLRQRPSALIYAAELRYGAGRLSYIARADAVTCSVGY